MWTAKKQSNAPESAILLHTTWQKNMKQEPNPKYLRRTLKRTAVISGMLVLISTTLGWLAFQRIPSWYQPVHVNQNELTEVRNSLPNTYQKLNDLVNSGKEKEFILPARRVTQWIVARGELWPDSRAWLPDWLRDPVVVFDRNECIIAVRLDYHGWQTILSIHLVSRVSQEAVTLNVVGVNAGIIPIPTSLLVEPLERLLNNPSLDIETLPDPMAKVITELRSTTTSQAIAQGISLPNHFRLPKGRRIVSIKTMWSDKGNLHILLKPM